LGEEDRREVSDRNQRVAEEKVENGMRQGGDINEKSCEV